MIVSIHLQMLVLLYRFPASKEGISWLFVYRKNSKYWAIYVLANSVYSDQTALKGQSDQDLNC